MQSSLLPITAESVNAEVLSDMFWLRVQENDYFIRVGVAANQNNSSGSSVAVN